MKTNLGRIFFGVALFASLLLLGVGEASAACNNGAHAEKTTEARATRYESIRNMKIAFFTDALELTAEQSQQFWPIYNESWKSRRELGHRRRDLFKTIREGGAGEKQLDELLEFMHQESKLIENCIAKLRKILPDDKVAKVFVAEEDFKNFLIRKAASGDIGSGSAKRP